MLSLPCGGRRKAAASISGPRGAKRSGGRRPGRMGTAWQWTPLRRVSDGRQDGSDVDLSVVGWDRHVVNFPGVRHLDFLVVWPPYIVIEHFAVNAGDRKGDRECPLRIGEIEEDQRNLLRFRCGRGSSAPVGNR